MVSRTKKKDSPHLLILVQGRFQQKSIHYRSDAQKTTDGQDERMDMEFANERERLKKEVEIFWERRQFLVGSLYFCGGRKFTIKKYQKEGCFFFSNFCS